MDDDSKLPVVYCNDVIRFVDYILQIRELDCNDVLMKIGADGEAGFFKVCMSMITDDNASCSSARFTDSSVKRLFLLAIVPDQGELSECEVSFRFVGNREPAMQIYHGHGS